MSTIATAEFLVRLESLYPTSAPPERNPWYIVAAVSFSGSNRPEEVPHVLAHALEAVTQHHERLLITRRIRDAVFEAGILTGYAKAINSLVALHEATPQELRDTEPLRDLANMTIPQYEARGESLFRKIYGDSADSVQSLLDSILPDMGWFSRTVGYGIVYGCDGILSQVETSYMMVAALVAGDTPRQVAWHLAGARRGGATLEEVRAVRHIAMEVAQASGVVWRDSVPEVKDD